MSVDLLSGRGLECGDAHHCLQGSQRIIIVFNRDLGSAIATNQVSVVDRGILNLNSHEFT